MMLIRGRAMSWYPAFVAILGPKGAVKDIYPGRCPESWSRGITVNNVQPGPIDTELIPPQASGRCRRRPPLHLTATGMLIEVAALVGICRWSGVFVHHWSKILP